MELRKSRFFLVAEIEPQVLAEITAAEFRIEIAHSGDELVEPLQIFSAESPQALGDLSRVCHLSSDEPKRKDERQPGDVLPIFT